MSIFAISEYSWSMDSKEIKQIFTDNIRRYRQLNDMTQQELAEAADISVGFLCDLESGKKWGTLETMAKISTALHIKPYQLLEPENNKNPAALIHEDLVELSRYISRTVDSRINSLLDKYAQ